MTSDNSQTTLDDDLHVIREAINTMDTALYTDDDEKYRKKLNTVLDRILDHARVSDPQTTTERLKPLLAELQKMVDNYDARMAPQKEIMERLTYIFNDDADLAKTVYDYAVMGHLSYWGQLRERFKPCQTKQ